ncbi:MAG: tetratricopeptide repeat protein [Clostridia bacterium]|nr:tetratricopeptide repeat protein [Clostridia bacterium]
MRKRGTRSLLFFVCCALLLVGCAAQETYLPPPAMPVGSPAAPWMQPGGASVPAGTAAPTDAPAWTMPPLPSPTPLPAATPDLSTPLPPADGSTELQEGVALYEQNKFDAAFDKFQESAALGNVEAAYRMALCQRDGQGVKASDKKAADLMRRAANGGVLRAMYEYGRMLQSGAGVDANAAEAVNWYEKAANQGDMEAIGKLGACYKNGIGTEVDGEKAAKWLKISADAGDAEAAASLGEMYYDGVIVPKDRELAMRYYGQAAEAGNVDGMFIAGVMLTENEADTDEEKAEAKKGFGYICQGADKKDPRCEFYLGALLYNGTNTEKDENLGVRFFIKAAQQGYQRAIKVLDQLDLTPDMVIDVHEMAKKIEEETANQTPLPSMYPENTPTPWLSVSAPFPDAGDEGVTVINVGRLRPGESYEDVCKVFGGAGEKILDVNEFQVYLWKSREVPTVRVTFEEGMLWELHADDGNDDEVSTGLLTDNNRSLD